MKGIQQKSIHKYPLMKSHLSFFSCKVVTGFLDRLSLPRLQDPNIEFLIYFGFGLFNVAANASEASRKDFQYLYRDELIRVN